MYDNGYLIQIGEIAEFSNIDFSWAWKREYASDIWKKKYGQAKRIIFEKLRRPKRLENIWRITQSLIWVVLVKDLLRMKIIRKVY